MTFQQNPWIDPRVEQLRMIQIEGYLRRNGWREGKSQVSPMRSFRDAKSNGVFLPGTDDDEFLRYAIDAVTCLARAENRFAGDVLTDLLAQPLERMDAKTPIAVNAETGDVMAPVANR